VGGLLASWGHSVLLLDQSDEAAVRARGLAESLPPSARKVLAQVGLLEAVDAAGFYRSTGNTVCWGEDGQRVETFGGALGYQVFRPDFDRLLLDCARSAGVTVRTGAHVRDVSVDAAAAATVRVQVDGETSDVAASWVLDCSGRAGVVARRFRAADRRTYALVGEWTARRGWRLPDPTHTVVEAYADGWSWSIPLSPERRHAGVMIDGSIRRDGRDLHEAYRAEIGKSCAIAETLREAELERVWACDASTYSSSRAAFGRCLFVGDAASFLDPLSSAGVKKALTSAWMAAVVVNTCLADPARAKAALQFFADWNAEVCETQRRRSREFAVEAVSRLPTPYWRARAEGGQSEAPERGQARRPVRGADLEAALRTLRQGEGLELALDERVGFAPRAVIRGREVVLEEALVLPDGAGRNASTGATRFVENVDVVALARLAGKHESVPDLFEAYCQTIGPAPLPNVLGGLSWLVAAGVLRRRNAVQC
jgi:flavin-dependent dehydrogenase